MNSRVRSVSKWLQKNNVDAIHKRFSKNLIKNYRPIIFLSILSNVFEIYTFNSFFNCFIQNQLYTECQSGFIPGNSCVAQLASIRHKIYKIFNFNQPRQIRETFLDVSKVFDKVWHKGLTFKLQSYGVDGSLLILREDYITGRQ